MQVLTLAASVLALMAVIFLAFLVWQGQRQNETLRQQVNTQLNEVNRQLLQTTGQIGARLDGASQMIGSVQRGLGELGEASRRIYDIGKDIASLQDILQPPKLRGILGEIFLKELLQQYVPTCCEYQYRFSSGETVDAVIRLGERLVPVDSKFPLENFRKLIEEADDAMRARGQKEFLSDVKKHIDAVATKYILPDEGTYDFALMYIPAENVYYEIIAKEGGESVADYARNRRVIPVSPSTLYAYLQVIHLGLRGLQVERHAEEILANLNRLQGDFARFTTDFEVLGNHIGNANKKYEEAGRRLARFGDKLARKSVV